MKLLSCMLCLVLLFVVALNAQNDDLVLNRVYFAAVEFKTNADRQFLSTLPDMLYSLITTVRPIIRTEYSEAANSIVTITARKKTAKEISVLFVLSQAGETKAEAEFSYQPEQMDFTRFKGFMDGTARRFASFLGEVKPEVKVTSLIKDTQTRDVIRSVQFTEAMSKPFELNIWVGSLLKAPSSYRKESGFSLQPMLHAPFPLELDLVWYFEKQQGLQFMLYFDFNDYMYFGYDTSETEDVPARSENVVVLGGVGYVFRTLGVFSTSYSVSLLLGAVNVKAKEDLINHNSGQISLSAGESIWLLYALMPLRLSFSYNITPQLALSTNVSFAFNPIVFMGMIFGVRFPYEASGSVIQMQFFSVGAAYRF
jgi:hypothetical protein